MIQSYTQPAPEPTTDNGAPEAIPAAHFRQKARQQHDTSSLNEKDRQNVSASSRVTDSLRQMHDAAQAELERSEYAKQTMEQSTAAFSQLGESYSSLETTLKSSRSLLGTLMKSQKSDTWYLKTSFYMLVTVAAWLVFRRLLYGPTWWLVWLPLKVIFGVGKGVGKAALSGRDVDVEKGRVEVGGSESVAVEGLPKKDLPTAKVGGDSETQQEDPDSMTEKVGKIMDAEADLEEAAAPEIVVDTKEAGEERPRDEL
jgi:protein transport protein SEC20